MNEFIGFTIATIGVGFCLILPIYAYVNKRKTGAASVQPFASWAQDLLKHSFTTWELNGLDQGIGHTRLKVLEMPHLECQLTTVRNHRKAAWILAGKELHTVKPTDREPLIFFWNNLRRIEMSGPHEAIAKGKIGFKECRYVLSVSGHTLNFKMQRSFFGISTATLSQNGEVIGVFTSFDEVTPRYFAAFKTSTKQHERIFFSSLFLML